MYAAVSSTQLLEMQGDLPSPLEAPKLRRHYFITGGYEYTIPDFPSVVLKPSLFIKTDFVSAQYDVTCLAEYNNIYWGGLSYRVQDAVALIVGFKPSPKMIIGYSYDFTTSAIGRNGRSSGSHEIMFGYCFQVEIPKPPPTRYQNVRHMGRSEY
jgi:type IX secretion system PorP/SprF family membrane protein